MLRSLAGLCVTACCLIAASSLLAACRSPAPRDAAAPLDEKPVIGRAVDLPGADGPLTLDYLACDRVAGKVWIPAAGSGSVDVLDIASGALARIEGFPTADREWHGKSHRVGPSSATIGVGFVYVGNGASSEICAIASSTLRREGCVTLPGAPDGVQYVASTREVWVSTPDEHAFVVLDVAQPATPVIKARIAVAGEPEGHAVDEANGLFYTNLEDADRTLAIDVKTRAVVGDWPSRCGEKGPRGMSFDTRRGVLYVACTDAVETMDVRHGGGVLSRYPLTGGVDELDAVIDLGRVYVAAGKPGVLTVLSVDEGGRLTLASSTQTSAGARVVVADGQGNAYVADGQRGRVLVFPAAPAAPPGPSEGPIR